MKKIVDILPKGEKNAIPAAMLAKQVGVSQRRLRELVTEERKNGGVILSSIKGYFIPESREEILAFMRVMDKRARHTFLAIQSARRMLNEIEGQYEMGNGM